VCEYFRVITCNLTGWPQYVDAYKTVMRVKHIQLAAEENTFMLTDNSHYSGICLLSDSVFIVAK
jgi:hypothetical protein